MNRRLVGACVLVCAVVGVGAAAAAPQPPPRLSLSAPVAAWGYELTVGVERAARPLRLYLVPRAAAASIRSRFDTRLSFIGSVSGARLRFTVPPLEQGRYALVYWCRGCGLEARRAPLLQIVAPLPGGCPVTTPNRRVPPGARGSASGWAFHGNGGLWALLPPDGTYSNAAGPDGTIGAKIPWVAYGVEHWRRLQVTYRRLDVPSPTLRAVTVHGTLGGYDGPSWASRMAFQAGCWHVTGRVLDASLSFVVQVEAE